MKFKIPSAIKSFMVIWGVSWVLYRIGLSLPLHDLGTEAAVDSKVDVVETLSENEALFLSKNRVFYFTYPNHWSITPLKSSNFTPQGATPIEAWLISNNNIGKANSQIEVVILDAKKDKDLEDLFSCQVGQDLCSEVAINGQTYTKLDLQDSVLSFITLFTKHKNRYYVITGSDIDSTGDINTIFESLQFNE